ncbi:apolipoprotein N-acyltransferase [Georgenia muralis]|uniref:Apolipoprotein N-acyltransferase n=1 Tax=Georgenia muralis TaxID=154117 RepID=A0A3N4Z944_9MICO|nr:apolipoprotein N-acyltransferase [Georgenia muralis]RPF28426.1 apolipoprotein N-acyltransferase [Georgenia muralis]
MAHDFPRRRWTLLLAAAGGLSLDTAFPDRSWWPMAYVGIALLLLALRRDSAPWGFVVGTVAGLGFFLPHLWWANEAVGEPIGWVALSVAEAGAVGLFGASWVLVRRIPWVARHGWARVLTVAVLWVAVEQLRSSWPFGGFPWGVLAFSQTDAPLVRAASLGGTTVVSLLVVVVGALLALAAVHLRTWRVGSASAAIVLAAVVVAGPWLVPLPSRAEAGTLRVGAVQGNVPTVGAEATSQAREVAANHAAGTEALPGAPGTLDVVLWPESASDIDPRTDADIASTVDAAARAVDAPILLGTQRYVDDPDQEGLRIRYNEMVLWEPGGPTDVTYTKQHPVPFGEYMPYRDFFRKFTTAVDLITVDMAAGTGTGLVPVPVDRLGRAVPVGVGICFEVAYDDLIRDAVTAGAEVLVIPTNNASFGYTQESTQQLAMSRFRAVEHGRAVVQVSTVGVSGIISPNGVVMDSTELFTAAQMTEALPLRTTTTLAARLGGWPAATVEVVAALALLAGLVATARHHREARRRRRTGGSRRGRPAAGRGAPTNVRGRGAGAPTGRAGVARGAARPPERAAAGRRPGTRSSR